jgi:hypothetical protein
MWSPSKYPRVFYASPIPGWTILYLEAKVPKNRPLASRRTLSCVPVSPEMRRLLELASSWPRCRRNPRDA